MEPFSQLSKALRVQQHSVWDKEGKQHTLEASVETKGLLGTDGRTYVLDLYRLTPLDIAWLNQYWTDEKDGETKSRERNYPHRMAVLRQELVDAYWRSELAKYVNGEVEKRKAARRGGLFYFIPSTLHGKVVQCMLFPFTACPYGHNGQ